MYDDTYHQAAEAASEFQGEDYTDDGGMEMLGRLSAFGIACIVIGMLLGKLFFSGS